jgi:hypothetical protein
MKRKSVTSDATARVVYSHGAPWANFAPVPKPALRFETNRAPTPRRPERELSQLAALDISKRHRRFSAGVYAQSPSPITHPSFPRSVPIRPTHRTGIRNSDCAVRGDQRGAAAPGGEFRNACASLRFGDAAARRPHRAAAKPQLNLRSASGIFGFHDVD